MENRKKKNVFGVTLSDLTDDNLLFNGEQCIDIVAEDIPDAYMQIAKMCSEQNGRPLRPADVETIELKMIDVYINY